MIDDRREFHRPARVYPAPVVRDDVDIPAPPQPPAKAGGGILQALLPVLGSVGMFGFALILGDSRYLVMAGILAGAMLLSGIAARVNQVRTAKRGHAERSARYRTVIADVRTSLLESSNRQRRWSRSSYPAPVDLWSVVVDRRRVWERRLEHDDFMRVRLGTGPVPAALAPRPARTLDPLTEPDPELVALVDQVVQDFGTIEDEPSLFDLAGLGCVAIVGREDEARQLARSIVLQLSVFRAPDDLRVIISHPPDAIIDWTWALRLPHTAADGGRLVTSDPEDLVTILDQVAGPRLAHLEQASSTIGPAQPVSFPAAVVVLDDYHPDGEVGRLELIDDLLGRAIGIGLTFVCIVDRPSAVPSVANATITASNGKVQAALAQPDAPRQEASADEASLALCSQLASMLEPLKLRTRSGRATTIDSAGLFELLDIGDPSLVTRDLMWKRCDPSEQLQTPIGVAEDGTPIMLDLKESSSGGMGPHGMLIGATGSGKSELLRTLVLGLAARHAPEDLAFVLVDFKGGATFNRLDRLPHSTGMITNLERDPSLVDRMLEALHGELERRQRVLHEAGGFDRADEYRAHRQAHPEAGLDPLPALVVVVDEFGELLAAKPEFSDLFATIGRVGRSLGVHLLLSTQRLEDGRIRKLEGHLRYRLCLRTFTADESMAVIGSKAAAELPPIPGVGYLKVDGAITAFKAGLVNRPLRGTEQTEMEHMIGALAGVDVESRRARPVWLEPLPLACELSPLTAGVHAPGESGWLRFPVGWEDDPRRQQQLPHELDFTGARGNLAIVGAPRTGKSTMLQTLLASASLTHDPEDVQFYAIDFGGGGLHLLEGLPHVGAVLSRSHRAEVAKLIRRLHSLAEERAESFRRHRITDMAAYHELRREGRIDDEMGEVFLVVDNWGAFCQEQPLDLVESAFDLIGSGLHHGIHLVVATPRWQDIKLAVRDHIGGRFEFRLGDAIDSEIDRPAARSLPGDVAGRGLGMGARQVQVALPRADGRPEPGSIPIGTEQLVSLAEERWGGRRGAAPVRVLPNVVAVGELAESPEVTLGLEEHRLGPWTVDLFGPDPHMLVFGDAESGKTNVLQRLVEEICEHHAPDQVQVAVVDYRRQLLQTVPVSHRLGVAASADSAAVIASRINSDLAARVLPDEVSTLRHSVPAFVLVVDDYDLVAGATGNPLSPLIDRVAQGRDLGFHLVLARRVGGVARSSFEPLFQRVRELGTQGVVLSGDPQEGPILGGVKAVPRSPGRGVWVSRGRTTDVQAVLCDPIGASTEEIRAMRGMA